MATCSQWPDHNRVNRPNFYRSRNWSGWSCILKFLSYRKRFPMNHSLKRVSTVGGRWVHLNSLVIKGRRLSWQGPGPLLGRGRILAGCCLDGRRSRMGRIPRNINRSDQRSEIQGYWLCDSDRQMSSLQAIFVPWKLSLNAEPAGQFLNQEWLLVGRVTGIIASKEITWQPGIAEKQGRRPNIYYR